MQHLRARPTWPVGDSDRSERQFLAAVLLRAIADAQEGDGEAAAWLEAWGLGFFAALDMPALDWQRIGQVGIVKHSRSGQRADHAKRLAYLRAYNERRRGKPRGCTRQGGEHDTGKEV